MVSYGSTSNTVTEYRMERWTYTIPETARILGIGRSAAYEAANRGEIPTIRIGKRILVPIEALKRRLSAGRTPPESV